MRCSLLVAAVTMSAAPGAAAAPAQSLPKEEDLQRYRKELEPGADLKRRLEAMKNVAFYDSVPMARLLVDSLAATLEHLEELEAERAENDARIDRILKAQIEKGRGATPDYTGVDALQAVQKRLGARITAEEEAVRGFVEALGSLKHEHSLEFLMKLAPRKPPRLRPALIDALGRIDDGRVAEHLIGVLEDPALDVRLAAGTALLRQRPEFVPAPSFAPLLRSADWQDRSLAIDALARLGGGEAMTLLVQQTLKEDGRLLADLCARLEQLTGQRFGQVPQAWVDWWQANRAGFPARGIDISQPMRVQRSASDADRYGNLQRFWGVEFDSLRVVYVIDISGSMVAAVDDFENEHPAPGRSRFELMRREVKASIQGLPPDSTFNVIAYSDVVLPWSDRNVPASKENKKAVFAWLDGLSAVGQTNIFDALETAFTLAPAAGGKNAAPRASRTGSGSGKADALRATGDTILFLSDGGPTCGRTTDCEEILKQVKAWNETRRITIHTLGIGKQVVRVFLERLAKENGGLFVAVEK